MSGCNLRQLAVHRTGAGEVQPGVLLRVGDVHVSGNRKVVFGLERKVTVLTRRGDSWAEAVFRDQQVIASL